MPESKTLPTLAPPGLPEVTECCCPIDCVVVQVTVSPASTVIVDGWNEVPTMLTAASLANAGTATAPPTTTRQAISAIRQALGTNVIRRTSGPNRRGRAGPSGGHRSTPARPRRDSGRD